MRTFVLALRTFVIFLLIIPVINKILVILIRKKYRLITLFKVQEITANPCRYGNI